MLWVDKYRPNTLDKMTTVNTDLAQHLKRLRAREGHLREVSAGRQPVGRVHKREADGAGRHPCEHAVRAANESDAPHATLPCGQQTAPQSLSVLSACLDRLTASEA